MQMKERIWKLRTDLHMTREQFAEEFGVSKQAVQKWETGRIVSGAFEIDRHFQTLRHFA